MGTIIFYLLRKYWYLAVMAGLLVFSFALLRQAKKISGENNRLNVNQEVLNKNFKSYKTAYGHSAVKIKALRYTVDEMKEYESDLLAKMNELKLKPKNVLSAAKIQYRDSIRIRTVIQYVDSSKCFTYTDKYNTVSGCYQGDSVDIKLENRDSLTTIVSRIPKHKFLWWDWGTKAIELTILSQNPNSKFDYAKYIEIKK